MTNKNAYNVKFFNFNTCTLIIWENYAYGKHEHKSANESEARQWLKANGWNIKSFS